MTVKKELEQHKQQKRGRLRLMVSGNPAITSEETRQRRFTKHIRAARIPNIELPLPEPDHKKGGESE